VLFRQLEYFVALARERHFARAAQVCYVSQPALSESIRKLERELGVPLVNRGRNFEGLTPEGDRLVIWARRILADHDALKHEVAAMQSGLEGQFRLAVIPAASTIASLLLDPFCAAHPLVSVSLETRLPSSEILDKLDRFEIDAGIVAPGNEPLAEWPTTLLYKEKTVLAASRELVPDSIDRLPWSELGQFPLCALNASMLDRRQIDEALAGREISLRPEVETDSIASIYSLAATGRWAGIVPHPWFHSFPRSAEVRLVPIVDPVMSAPVLLVTGRSEPPSVLGKAFTAAAEAMALDELFAAAVTVQRIKQGGSPTSENPVERPLLSDEAL
jgi:DNA-binding transcriptional LysR family regulator